MGDLGKRLKEIRKDYKLTQKMFGERIGVTHAHISNMESGKDFPSESLIMLICKEYCVNDEWLRYGNGEKYDQKHLSEKADVKIELTAGIEVLNDKIRDLSELLKTSPDVEVTQISYCLSSIIDILKNKDLRNDLRFDYLDALEDLFSDLGRYVQNLTYTTSISFEKTIDEKAKEIDSIISKYSKPFNRAYEEIGEVYLQKYIQGYESLRGEHAAASEVLPWNDSVSDRVISSSSSISTGIDIPYNERIIRNHNISELFRQRNNRVARPQIIYMTQGTGKTETLGVKLLAEFLEQRKKSKYDIVAEEASPYVPILGKVAAGPPIDLIEDNSGLSPVFGVKDVDFTLQISGDSMDPEYPDGSYVFVKKQETLENGEIGIIMINDQVACKKFYRVNGHVELRSINKKYDPIVLMSGDVRILGKVIKD